MSAWSVLPCLAIRYVGVLAIEYGRRCPRSVSHVIVAGTPPTGDIPQMAKAAAAFFETDGSEERKAILKENYAKLPPGTPPEQAVFAQTPMRFFDPRFDAVPLFAECDLKPALFQHVLGPLTATWNVTADTESLEVPILIAHGRYDYVSPSHDVGWDRRDAAACNDASLRTKRASDVFRRARTICRGRAWLDGASRPHPARQ